MKVDIFDDEAGEALIIPRDPAAAQTMSDLEKVKKLPLVTIHGPSGTGKSDLAGEILTRRLKVLSGRANPKMTMITIGEDDTSLDLALKITDQIIEHHSEFKNRKAAVVFREKMQRSVRRNPADAAERIKGMMRDTEKLKFDIKKVQMVICLDGVDGLFRERASTDGDLANTGICGAADDPVGFLTQLVGLKTILFTMTYRNWVSSVMDNILDEGDILNQRRYDLDLSYPESDESELIVKKMLIPIKAQNAGLEAEIDELGDDLIDTLKKNPATVSNLPKLIQTLFADEEGGFTNAKGCLERHRERDGFRGLLAKHADSVYLQQNTGSKLAVEEVFTKMIEQDGSLSLNQILPAEDLTDAAALFVKNRVLSLDGTSVKNAKLSPIHEGLLTRWNRAVHWSEADRIVGLSQIREFDDRSLSWELGDRNSDLLLKSDQNKEDGETILKDSELYNQLSPLTRDFLNQSLHEESEVQKWVKKLAVPVGSVVGGIALFLAAVFILGKEEPVEMAATEVPAAVVDPAEGAIQTISEIPTPASPEVPTLASTVGPPLTMPAAGNLLQTSIEETELEKLEAERIAAELKSYRERAAKRAEADRLKVAKAETERLAGIEAERLAMEQAELESRKLAEEKVETERLAKLEAERVAAEKAMQLAEERAAAERLEAEMALAKVEASGIQRIDSGELDPPTELGLLRIAEMPQESPEEQKVTIDFDRDVMAKLSDSSLPPVLPSAGKVYLPLEMQIRESRPATEGANNKKKFATRSEKGPRRSVAAAIANFFSFKRKKDTAPKQPVIEQPEPEQQIAPVVEEKVEIVAVQKKVPIEGLQSATGHIENRSFELAQQEARSSMKVREIAAFPAQQIAAQVGPDSPWREILNAMGEGIADQDLDHVLDTLTHFHQKAVLNPKQKSALQVDELKDLTSHLGKLALIQQDKVAMQSAWKLESGSKTEGEMSTNLRMLMARIALNAGREKEAVAYLGQTPIQETINPELVQFMKSALGWHFEEANAGTSHPPQASR